jgi:hypothetical protein
MGGNDIHRRAAAGSAIVVVCSAQASVFRDAASR